MTKINISDDLIQQVPQSSLLGLCSAESAHNRSTVGIGIERLGWAGLIHYQGWAGLFYNTLEYNWSLLLGLSIGLVSIEKNILYSELTVAFCRHLYFVHDQCSVQC